MCGCEERRSRLNDFRPGLGDKVATVAEPIKEAYVKSKPTVAIAGFVVGAFLIPWVLAKVRSLR
jgi:hypothetical protein